MRIEEVRKEFEDRGYLLLDNEYINNRTKLNCCDVEGFKYAITLISLKDERTKEPSKFAKYNPHTIDNINNFIKINNLNVELLSEEFTSMNKDKLLFKCECGNEYSVCLEHFIRYKMFKCKKCSMSQEDRKLSLEEAKRQVKEFGYIPLFEEYIDSKTPLPIQTTDGYKGVSILSNMKTMKDISTFDYRNPFIFYNIRKYIQDNKINCQVVETDEYKGRGHKLEFICSCGKHFKTQWVTFTLGEKHRCDVCTKAQSNISLKTENWLREHNFSYEKEYSFEGCRYKRRLKFDYKVNLGDGFKLIEVDGSYHYNNPRSEKTLIEQQKKDEIKNQYCRENNIELIRLPWWWFRETELYKKELSNKLLDIE